MSDEYKYIPPYTDPPAGYVWDRIGHLGDLQPGVAVLLTDLIKGLELIKLEWSTDGTTELTLLGHRRHGIDEYWLWGHKRHKPLDNKEKDDGIQSTQG